MNVIKFYVCSYFRFVFESRMWDLVVLIPDHRLSICLEYLEGAMPRQGTGWGRVDGERQNFSWLETHRGP